MKSLIKKLIVSLFLLFYCESAQSQPYVVLISFDGFRWDYVERGITPNFEFIKENGVHAKSLRPCFPTKTFPNHISIITGMHPENHGIISNGFNDYSTGRYFNMSDTVEVRDARWYRGEAFWETAGRQGIITASYFWPGSEVTDSNRRPTYFYNYKHSTPYKERMDGIIDWLKLPYDRRPHFITAYFDAADTYGHKYGPYSEEIDLTIAQLDSILGYLLGRLEEIEMYDSTNIIVLTDHGMTQIADDKIINIEKLLEEFNYNRSDTGPFMLIEPEDGELEKIYNKLIGNENHFKAYKREDVPKRFHYSNNPLISKLVIIAENGWGVETNRSIENLKKYGNKGNHGYDNYWIDMHGMFYATGPSFRKNYQVGTVDIIDIYPLLCKIFNIIPNQLIDGKLQRIDSILR